MSQTNPEQLATSITKLRDILRDNICDNLNISNVLFNQRDMFIEKLSSYVMNCITKNNVPCNNVTKRICVTCYLLRVTCYLFVVSLTCVYMC